MHATPAHSLATEQQTAAATAPRPAPWLSLPLGIAAAVFLWSLLAEDMFPDGDPFWHIAVGKWIVSHGAVPVSEFFSHSMPGIPWTAHEWLSEVLMYATFQAGEWQALHLLASACLALTAGCMMRFLLDRIEPIYALAIGALSLATVYTHFLGRPHVFVWPLTALWLATLVVAVEQRSRPPLWLLPLLLLWTNLHASFTLAIGFAGALALDATFTETGWPARKARALQWAPFLALCAVVVLVNPRGLHAITHAAGVMQMKQTLQIVDEWRSADFHQFQIFLPWVLCLLAAGYSLQVKLSPFRVIFIVVLTYLALKHQRYHALAGLAAPFILARPLGDALRAVPRAATQQAGALDAIFESLARRSRRGSTWVVAGAALLAAWAMRPLIRNAPDARATPSAALAAFRRTGATGNVLNAYVLGGYLISEGVPVFIDGRGDMYGDTFMVEASQAIGLSKPHALETALQKYRITWTMLTPGTPALELLDHLEEWQRVHTDSIAVVHVRRDALPRPAPPTPTR
ncbi:MAG: hypothetical protein V4813_00170 [Gemmatimonadota bacterium]